MTDRNRSLLIYSVRALLIGAPMLIYFNIIPFSMRFFTLVVAGIIVVSIALMFRSGKFGFGYVNLKESISAGLGASLLVIAISLFVSGGARHDGLQTPLFYAFYIFVSCPLQELTFRGSLRVLLQGCSRSEVRFILESSALYSIAHIIYRDPYILFGTFFLGLIWSLIYILYNNIWGIIISHVLVGVVTIYFGVI